MFLTTKVTKDTKADEVPDPFVHFVFFVLNFFFLILLRRPELA